MEKGKAGAEASARAAVASCARCARTAGIRALESLVCRTEMNSNFRHLVSVGRTRKTAGRLFAAAAAVASITLSPAASADVASGQDALSAQTEYKITLAIVSSSGEVGAVQFDVFYKGENGSFSPTFNGTRGACRVSLTNAFGVSNVRNDGRITIGVAGVPGFLTPTQVASCNFSAKEQVKPDDFDIRVVDVIDSKGAFIDATPVIRVTAITLDDGTAKDVGGLASTSEIPPANRQ
jgi:hypothetical protein